MPRTRVGRDRVCERMPFLQATSGNPGEGMMVPAESARSEKSFMKNKSNSGSGQRRGGKNAASKAARDNRANQLNPNNDRYRWSREGARIAPEAEAHPIHGNGRLPVDVPGRRRPGNFACFDRP